METKNSETIKTFWIDLGNVLLNFDFNITVSLIKDRICVSLEEAFNYFFDSPDTVEFEQGKISPFEFYKRTCQRLGLKMEFEDFKNCWNKIFYPNKEFIDLFKKINYLYRTVLISNINVLHYNYIKKTFPVIEEFDHKVLSFEVGVSKPHALIYQEALKYSLGNIENILYIDDRKDLIDSALSQGIPSFWFKGTPSFREYLKYLDVFIPNDDFIVCMDRFRNLFDDKVLFLVDNFSDVLYKNMEKFIRNVERFSIHKLNNSTSGGGISNVLDNFRNIIIVGIPKNNSSPFWIKNLEESLDKNIPFFLKNCESKNIAYLELGRDFKSLEIFKLFLLKNIKPH